MHTFTTHYDAKLRHIKNIFLCTRHDARDISLLCTRHSGLGVGDAGLFGMPLFNVLYPYPHLATSCIRYILTEIISAAGAYCY